MSNRVELGERIIRNHQLSSVQPTSEGNDLPVDPWRVLMISGAGFLSGVVALAYEIAWIRLLALVFGSSTYSFSLMLEAFLAGIPLGSYLISRHTFSHIDSYRLFGIAELGIVVSIIVILSLYQWSRQKSGGNSAVSSEFVISGVIFDPSRVQS